ncbi:leucine-, glutamate- and lysine-rich protein 1 isoform X2 [Rhinatrema bivittatum]|uniref:leucine-, glutamate- and lysine-rich protein 1 isoform X2 n=1 Tax=Rhinatrema bivittatum TaxID=194408 RepID=UPI00112D8086|nr:leucine-, glutamate- and lysine-rich protein 1 isoform X2 [Rhinatrema bivittatum]
MQSAAMQGKSTACIIQILKTLQLMCMALLNSSTESKTMDQPLPIHPLPEEIQKMSRDETVCTYCGVSYLILHEFKLMEEKVKAIEEEMRFYQGSVDREKKLQTEFKSLSKKYEQCKTNNKFKSESIQNITLQLKNKQDELESVNEDQKCCQEQLKVACSQSQTFREKITQYQLTLRKSLLLLHFSKTELAAVRKEISSALKIWTTLKGELFLKMEAITETWLREITKLSEALAVSQKKNVGLEEQVKDLQLVSDSFVLKTQQLQISLQMENELQIRCQELQKQIVDLQSQIENVGLNFQKAAAEMEYYKEMYMMKSKETDDYRLELGRLESEKENSESRLTKQLREKDNLLLEYQQKCNHLLEEVAEKERTEINIKRSTSQLENELDMLKTILRQTEDEVVKLKQEREMMLISHQNKIEQLQEGFRQKMLNDDSWRQKMENELRKERTQYSTDLKEKVLKLKEEAKMELDIEREKHEELLRKYQDELKELQMKIPILINNASNDLQTEVETLEKKLQETQSKLVQKDQAKAKEIQSLKLLISELELQQKKQQDSSSLATEETRKETQQKSEELKELKEELKLLMQHFNQAQEEKSFLQETVRRECEERYELTKALSQAREQLLELRQLSGNGPFSQTSSCRVSLSSSSSSVSNKGQKVFTTPPSSKGTKFTGLYSISRSASTPATFHHRSSDSTSLPLLPSPPLPREKESVTINRQKIIGILRRKSSQL